MKLKQRYLRAALKIHFSLETPNWIQQQDQDHNPEVTSCSRFSK